MPLGLKTAEGDRYFENRRAQSDNADRKQAQSFFNMTCQIGEEMDKKTSVITFVAAARGLSPRVLDIGMAPGGSTETVLRKHCDATIRGITLPLDIGGLEVMLPRWNADPRVLIEFLDVTMLADEMGRPTTSIPTVHPDIANISSNRPFQGENFDLVFCGATVQLAHARADYRESQERLRLATSQLVVALQHLRDHGSLVLVLHKPEAFYTAEIIRTFTRFSNVPLFKPRKKHAVRSSFYMVATSVDMQSKETQSAILGWKKQWENATFQLDDAPSACSRVSEDRVCEMLAEFGPQLIKLATPVWRTQADGLRSAPFLKE
jgi:23S rRNA U2552 (ribose-2'-O)-methylase RlmE/FtsJ